jgi:hypothetical protein
MSKITAKKYVAKYISKSFHLRNLYAQHGLKESSKTYTFFRNLYDYDEREAIVERKSKIDQETREERYTLRIGCQRFTSLPNCDKNGQTY